MSSVSSSSTTITTNEELIKRNAELIKLNTFFEQECELLAAENRQHGLDYIAQHKECRQLSIDLCAAQEEVIQLRTIVQQPQYSNSQMNAIIQQQAKDLRQFCEGTSGAWVDRAVQVAVKVGFDRCIADTEIVPKIDQIRSELKSILTAQFTELRNLQKYSIRLLRRNRSIEHKRKRQRTEIHIQSPTETA